MRGSLKVTLLVVVVVALCQGAVGQTQENQDPIKSESGEDHASEVGEDVKAVEQQQDQENMNSEDQAIVEENEAAKNKDENDRDPEKKSDSQNGDETQDLEERSDMACAGKRKRRNIKPENLQINDGVGNSLLHGSSFEVNDPDFEMNYGADNRDGRKFTVWTTIFSTFMLTSTSFYQGTTVSVSGRCSLAGFADSCFG